MASDRRAQLEVQFFKARDEYIAAIKIHSDALAAAMQTEAIDANAEYDRASRELEQKRGAYRRATEDLRGLNSRRHD
jgi:hypothetical protein